MCVSWQVFAEWNNGELESFLIEITRDILKYHDTDATSLVDKILDTAGQVSYSFTAFLLPRWVKYYLY